MEDKRAHERLNDLEGVMKKHFEDHQGYEATLTDISNNTREIVELVRGAKGVRALIIWASPVAVFAAAVYTWIKTQ